MRKLSLVGHKNRIQDQQVPTPPKLLLKDLADSLKPAMLRVSEAKIVGDGLYVLLKKAETQQTLSELRALVSYCETEQTLLNTESLLPVTQFLAIRWLRIQFTEITYSHAPAHPINQLCTNLAETINEYVLTDSKEKLSHHRLLMPKLIESKESNITSSDQLKTHKQLATHLVERGLNSLISNINTIEELTDIINMVPQHLQKIINKVPKDLWEKSTITQLLVMLGKIPVQNWQAIISNLPTALLQAIKPEDLASAYNILGVSYKSFLAIITPKILKEKINSYQTLAVYYRSLTGNAENRLAALKLLLQQLEAHHVRTQIVNQVEGLRSILNDTFKDEKSGQHHLACCQFLEFLLDDQYQLGVDSNTGQDRVAREIMYRFHTMPQDLYIDFLKFLLISPLKERRKIYIEALISQTAMPEVLESKDSPSATDLPIPRLLADLNSEKRFTSIAEVLNFLAEKDFLALMTIHVEQLAWLKTINFTDLRVILNDKALTISRKQQLITTMRTLNRSFAELVGQISFQDLSASDEKDHKHTQLEMRKLEAKHFISEEDRSSNIQVFYTQHPFLLDFVQDSKSFAVLLERMSEIKSTTEKNCAAIQFCELMEKTRLQAVINDVDNLVAIAKLLTLTSIRKLISLLGEEHLKSIINRDPQSFRQFFLAIPTNQIELFYENLDLTTDDWERLTTATESKERLGYLRSLPRDLLNIHCIPLMNLSRSLKELNPGDQREFIEDVGGNLRISQSFSDLLGMHDENNPKAQFNQFLVFLDNEVKHATPDLTHLITLLQETQKTEPLKQAILYYGLDDALREINRKYRQAFPELYRILLLSIVNSYWFSKRWQINEYSGYGPHLGGISKTDKLAAADNLSQFMGSTLFKTKSIEEKSEEKYPIIEDKKAPQPNLTTMLIPLDPQHTNALHSGQLGRIFRDFQQSFDLSERSLRRKLLEVKTAKALLDVINDYKIYRSSHLEEYFHFCSRLFGGHSRTQKLAANNLLAQYAENKISFAHLQGELNRQNLMGVVQEGKLRLIYSKLTTDQNIQADLNAKKVPERLMPEL